ncbi:MAG TPA: hypothetical protein VGM37_13240 [Armatimonadota bacterium]|jgi:hypothetical protein
MLAAQDIFIRALEAYEGLGPAVVRVTTTMGIWPFLSKTTSEFTLNDWDHFRGRTIRGRPIQGTPRIEWFVDGEERIAYCRRRNEWRRDPRARVQSGADGPSVLAFVRVRDGRDWLGWAGMVTAAVEETQLYGPPALWLRWRDESWLPMVKPDGAGHLVAVRDTTPRETEALFDADSGLLRWVTDRTQYIHPGSGEPVWSTVLTNVEYRMAPIPFPATAFAFTSPRRAREVALGEHGSLPARWTSGRRASEKAASMP